jgi:hypothetical protein
LRTLWANRCAFHATFLASSSTQDRGKSPIDTKVLQIESDQKRVTINLLLFNVVKRTNLTRIFLYQALLSIVIPRRNTPKTRIGSQNRFKRRKVFKEIRCNVQIIFHNDHSSIVENVERMIQSPSIMPSNLVVTFELFEFAFQRNVTQVGMLNVFQLIAIRSYRSTSRFVSAVLTHNDRKQSFVRSMFQQLIQIATNCDAIAREDENGDRMTLVQNGRIQINRISNRIGNPFAQSNALYLIQKLLIGSHLLPKPFFKMFDLLIDRFNLKFVVKRLRTPTQEDRIKIGSDWITRWRASAKVSD